MEKPIRNWTYAHKEHTTGVIVSHLEMGPARCRETSSGLPLIQHNGELDFLNSHYIWFYAGCIILFRDIYPTHLKGRSVKIFSYIKSVHGSKTVGARWLKGLKELLAFL